jgi:arsenate reductase
MKISLYYYPNLLPYKSGYKQLILILSLALIIRFWTNLDMVTLYGIKNCDTVKKALKWLTTNDIEHELYDFKKQPLTAELLTGFVEQSDWSLLLNKRSTTFRNLPDEVKNNLTEEVMFNAVLEQPTLLKRPLLPYQDKLNLGFKAEQYQTLFTANSV